MTKHVAVLMGGWSAERDVSLNSGKACAAALKELGYKVTEIDMKPDVGAVLAELRPDVVFNALHGTPGEDGSVQGMLDLMKIPYTHSGVLASAVAMDKPMAKLIFTQAGIRSPKGKTLSHDALLAGEPMPRPYVVKPACEGSSVGVHIMLEGDNRPLRELIADERKGPAQHAPSETYLVEEYIPGRELTCAVLDDTPLGVTELRVKAGFYDYTNKYTDGKTEHLCPAPLPDDIYNEVMRLSLVAHKALGCRGLTRSDFRFDESKGRDGLYILELNTQPGMTALSLSPELAKHAGIPFKELVQKLVEGACCG